MPASHVSECVASHQQSDLQERNKRHKAATRDGNGDRLFVGDTRLSTVHRLLARIDDLGYA